MMQPALFPALLPGEGRVWYVPKPAMRNHLKTPGFTPPIPGYTPHGERHDSSLPLASLNNYQNSNKIHIQRKNIVL